MVAAHAEFRQDGRDDVYSWPSVTAFIADCKATIKDDTAIARHAARDHSWSLGLDTKESLVRAIKGDVSIGALNCEIPSIAESFADELRLSWAASPVGQRVSVPDALAGHPAAMRKRVKRPIASRNVTIYSALGCSGMFGADLLLKRGQSILALVQALQSIGCGVDFYVYHCGSKTYYGPADRFNVVKVESKPLDLSVSGFVIGHPAFARQVMFDYNTVEYGWYGQHGDKAHNEAEIRRVLGMRPEDIHLPRAGFEDPIVRTPELWIRERLSQAIHGIKETGVRY